MTTSELSKAGEAERPALDVDHGVRIGKSVRAFRSRRGSRNSPRDMLALKFMHLPDETDLTKNGQLTHSQNRVSVELPTTSETQTQLFSGNRRTPNANSAVSDYVLVFADGVFWLERIADNVNCLRNDGPREGSMEVVANDEMKMQANDLTTDPDSWMNDQSPDESGSPITPEEDDEDDVHAAVTTTTTTTTVTETTATATAPTNRRNSSTTFATMTPTTAPTVRSSQSAPTSPDDDAAHNGLGMKTPSPSHVASKSIAGKTVACKTLPGLSSSATAAGAITTTTKQSESGDGIQTEEVVMETVEVDEDDADDDRASKSSSSDSDSDESSSDSDSDSADYTDRSSSDED